MRPNAARSQTGPGVPDDRAGLRSVWDVRSFQYRFLGHVRPCPSDVLLIGLYTREPIAWFTAPWITAMGAGIMTVFFVLVVISGTTKLWILCVAGLDIALAWVFFALLGRPDSRAYFNAPSKS